MTDKEKAALIALVDLSLAELAPLVGGPRWRAALPRVNQLLERRFRIRNNGLPGPGAVGRYKKSLAAAQATLS